MSRRAAEPQLQVVLALEARPHVRRLADSAGDEPRLAEDLAARRDEFVRDLLEQLDAALAQMRRRAEHLVGGDLLRGAA
jgi:hypothetical protein